jgi:hypothetical protein
MRGRWKNKYEYLTRLLKEDWKKKMQRGAVWIQEQKKQQPF